MAKLIAQEGNHETAQQDSESFYEPAYSLQPANLELAFKLGNIHCRALQYREAVNVYKASLKQNSTKPQNTAEEETASPAGKGDKPPMKARVFVNMGVAYEGLKKVQDACKAYKNALKIHGNYPAALKLLGMCPLM